MKVATVLLNTVTDHVIQESQAAFMQGRNILNGVVVLHEAVHETLKKVEWGHLEVRF
jgi:hypothetical protein